MANRFLGLVCFFFFSTAPLYAEYRAYWLEVFDLFDKTRYEYISGNWDAVNFEVTHGGRNRVRALIKATWMCYGYTAKQKPCPMPRALDPQFQIGQPVQVMLALHPSYLWSGVIEVALWRADLGSNVYGVRFRDRYNLYGVYYEKDLTALPLEGNFGLDESAP